MGDSTTPETMRQARRWEEHCTKYVRAGLCYRCAAQAAWGHQIGFTSSHRPCESCTPIVAAFPHAEVNAWRSLTRAPSASQLPARELMHI